MGKTDSRLSAAARAAAPERKRLVYVVPHLTPGGTEHFAHIPALLEALAEHVDVAVIVERGSYPRSSAVTRVLEINGDTLVSRVRRTVRAVARCAADGHDTYFLRYSRLFLVVLLLTYPRYRHRILLWRSGTADLVEPQRRRTLRQRLDNGLNWLLLRFVHRLVTGPETMVELMSQRWGVPRRKVNLLYNDVDAERFAPLAADARLRARHRMGWDPDEFVVLFVHRLSFRRGTRLLPPLPAAVQDALHRPVRLVVVGDGPDRALLERAAADVSGLDVLGPLPNTRLPDLYGAADCFLMPSYEEGFPRVLLEAMAAEVPIVTTAAGGSADVVGPDYPYVAPVGDRDALAHHLVAIGALPAARRADVGAMLRRRAVERFSPTEVAAMLADLL